MKARSRVNHVWRSRYHLRGCTCFTLSSSNNFWSFIGLSPHTQPTCFSHPSRKNKEADSHTRRITWYSSRPPVGGVTHQLTQVCSRLPCHLGEVAAIIPKVRNEQQKNALKKLGAARRPLRVLTAAHWELESEYPTCETTQLQEGSSSHFISLAQRQLSELRDSAAHWNPADKGYFLYPRAFSGGKPQ